MPGQDSAIKDLTKTFDLPRDIGATTNPEILSGLIVTQAGRLRKFVELSPEVKNLFLQIYRFTGAEIWEFYSVRGDIKLPAQDSLADTDPPFFYHRSGMGRGLLKKP